MTTAIKPLMTGGSDLPQTIVYKYDLLNRIAGAEHLNAQIDAQNKFLQGITDDKYKTAYTYDQNGNITSLKRHDQNGLIFDDFTYHYLNDIDAPNSPTNRLGYVGDIVTDSLKNFDIDNQNIDNYVYNKIGQLVKDKAENIDTIIWNNQAKIKEIIQSDNDPDLEFRYDPMGNRIAKIVKPKNSSGYVLDEPNWIYTYYVRDAQGNVMGVYKRDTLLDFSTVYQARFTIEEHHLYGSDRLGIEKPSDNLLAEVIVNWDGNYLSAVDSTNSIFHKDPNYYQLIIGDKNYEMKNHLGNVLAVVSDRKLLKTPLNGSFNGFEPDIVSFSDYYPFGMAMGGRNGSVESYRFGFNGKEMDNEVSGTGNQYDYGFRIYNPRLGKFLSVDPLFQSYPWYTPYQFAGNKPIWAIDLDGLEEKIVIYNEDKYGNVTSIEKTTYKNVEDYGPLGNGTYTIHKKADGTFTESYTPGKGNSIKAFQGSGISQSKFIEQGGKFAGLEKRLNGRLIEGVIENALIDAGSDASQVREDVQVLENAPDNFIGKFATFKEGTADKYVSDY